MSIVLLTLVQLLTVPIEAQPSRTSTAPSIREIAEQVCAKIEVDHKQRILDLETQLRDENERLEQLRINQIYPKFRHASERFLKLKEQIEELLGRDLLVLAENYQTVQKAWLQRRNVQTFASEVQAGIDAYIETEFVQPLCSQMQDRLKRLGGDVAYNRDRDTLIVNRLGMGDERLELPCKLSSHVPWWGILYRHNFALESSVEVSIGLYTQIGIFAIYGQPTLTPSGIEHMLQEQGRWGAGPRNIYASRYSIANERASSLRRELDTARNSDSARACQRLPQ